MRIRGAVLELIGRPRPYAESRPLSVGELELAPPGDSELLVRIETAGLCHSDLSVVDGSRVRPVPMLLGHEAGSAANAAGTLMAGERRLSRDGQPVNHHLGVSGFATHAVLGSAVPSHDIPHFVGLWRAGRLPVESLVSATITLDEINSGLDQLADGHSVRQLISFD